MRTNKGLNLVLAGLALAVTLGSMDRASGAIYRSQLHPSDSLIIITDARGQVTLHSPARFLAVGFWRNDRFLGFTRTPDPEPDPESEATATYRVLDALYLGDSLFATSTREGMDATSSEAERWELTEESVLAFASRMAHPEAMKRFVDRVPGAFDVALTDHPPVPIKRVPPSYPDSARQAGIEGTVMVRALIGRDGRVARAVIEHSIAGLDEESQRAVMRWSFKPARYRGRVVPRWVSIPVKFSMH